MNDQWSSHLEIHSLTEIIRLQNQLSGALTPRFEHPCFDHLVELPTFADNLVGETKAQHS
jgi:hypothetical protein